MSAAPKQPPAGGVTHITHTTQQVIDAEAWEQQLGYVLERLDDLMSRQVTPEMVEAASERVLRRFASDPEFWRSGIEHMAQHAANQSAQWVGRRMLTAFLAAAVSAAVVWMVKSGKAP